MNGLSLQNMNGVSGAMLSNLSAPLTIEIDHVDLKTRFTHAAGLGQPENPDYADLDYGWRFDRTEPPVPRDHYVAFRRRVEKGETYRSDEAWPPNPLTPSHDERNLPTVRGTPLRQLPVQDYPGSYPHDWVPYEEMTRAVGPDLPPVPPGWAAPYALDAERSRAVQAAMPSPAAGREHMARDVSGFVGQISPEFVPFAPAISPADQSAATAAATNAVIQNAPPDATAATINKLIDVAASAGSLYLQQKAIQDAKDRETEAAARQQAALAARARQMGVPYRPPERPFYESPVFIVLAAAAAAGGGYLLLRKGGRASANRGRR